MSEILETENQEADELEGLKEEKYLIFSILGRQFSFPSHLISEIALFDTVYPLPLLPPYVLGVINRYSIPYALFDVGLLLFNEESPRSKVLVLKDEIDRIAFLIDDVIGIADVAPEEMLIVEQSAESTYKTEAVSASFCWKDEDVFVLDIRKILAHITEETV